MTTNLAEKAARAVRLLFGMRNPVIAQALARYGFTDAVIQEGWRVVREAAPAYASPMGRPRNVSQATVTMLEDWQSEWFPVIQLALEARYPTIASALMAGLPKGGGAKSALAITTLMQRLDAMTAGEATYGADGPRARKVLEARGVSERVVGEAKALLTELEQLADVIAPDPAAAVEADQAEVALTTWYREWSGIARVAIQSRGMLRQLGLVGSHHASSDGSEPAATPSPAAVTPSAAPAPSPNGGATPVSP